MLHLQQTSSIFLPFTKKIFHQTVNGLSNYHSTRAMVANLAKRDAWEIRNVSSMQDNIPIFRVFFISAEPANSTGKILRQLHSLEVKIHSNCLGRSWNPPTEWPYKYFWHSSHRQIISHLQKFSPTHHSSFMMPAWGLLQQKMTQKILINRKLTRFEPMCSLISRKQRPHTDVTIWKLEPSTLLNSTYFQLNFLYAITKF